MRVQDSSTKSERSIGANLLHVAREDDQLGAVTVQCRANGGVECRWLRVGTRPRLSVRPTLAMACGAKRRQLHGRVSQARSSRHYWPILTFSISHAIRSR